MTALTFVLMYHRICELDAQSACWFARGTAVTPARFEAQMAWLRARARIVTLADALGSCDDSAPRCVVTFDDSYRDALVAVGIDIPITVFAVAEHSGDAREPLWFDRYYDILHRARRRRGVPFAALSLQSNESAPAIDEDLRWWVRGPLKERLQDLAPSARLLALAALAEVLDADGRTSASDLYLTHEELRRLADGGHCVGGHGATHTRLTQLDDEALQRELRASRRMVEAVAPTSMPPFCYPDGAYDARVVAATEAAGFGAGCTVEVGTLCDAPHVFAIPRLLMRNVLPEAPGWPAEFGMLLPRQPREALR
jgi:peptidoglycan/xylan/chitin deacetylase (PgdA/CDA1 family)